MALAVDNIT